MLTVMVAVVAKVLHFTVPAQPVAVNVAVSALHKLFLFVLITGAAGLVKMFIIMLFDDVLSPQLLLHVAV